MPLPKDYAERVYAGVLGKIIGVYAGRPFEGWSNAEIMARLGEVDYYVNNKVGEYNRSVLGLNYTPPLVVTDDDITGTFTFLRALEDHGYDRNISAERIGRTWLNYIIENRTVFWWGGLGNSTEHTAYLRLRQGITAPESGSSDLNGKIVSEQIGSQIFIDGWAMVAPGDPEFAAELARKAASVSHDGEAIFGAQVIAAMESAAFVESRMDALLDIGSSVIPKDSVIYHVVSDVRGWHAKNPDWRQTFARIQEKYGYDTFGGNVHIVPNHAIVIMGLLYGKDDFQTAMNVVNTAGWDTDCNAANVGCLMGIRDGLALFDRGPDWRSPVADRILMPTADGGRAVSDAVIEAMHIVDAGRMLAGETPSHPKNGARFHFEFPGSVQGFSPEQDSTTIGNIEGSSIDGRRSLEVRFRDHGSVSTPVFILPEELGMRGYQLMASPTLYPGQRIRARAQARYDSDLRLFIKVYNENGTTDIVFGASCLAPAGKPVDLLMYVPDTGGQPVAAVGLDGRSAGENTMNLDWLHWDGTPKLVLGRPKTGGPTRTDTPDVWRRAWINGVDQWESHWKEAYRLVQNRGRGLLIQGTREWNDYQAKADIRISLAESAGIAVRVQGMQRYYALLLCHGDLLRLVKVLDGEKVLAEMPFRWEAGVEYELILGAQGPRIRAWVDGILMFDLEDTRLPLLNGAAAFVIEAGHMSSEALSLN